MRKSTWYWRIWWWLGYHGLYQFIWVLRGDKKLGDYKFKDYVYMVIWLVILNRLIYLFFK